jgi:hypothetical protein
VAEGWGAVTGEGRSYQAALRRVVTGNSDRRSHCTTVVQEMASMAHVVASTIYGAQVLAVEVLPLVPLCNALLLGVRHLPSSRLVIAKSARECMSRVRYTGGCYMSAVSVTEWCWQSPTAPAPLHHCIRNCSAALRNCKSMRLICRAEHRSYDLTSSRPSSRTFGVVRSCLQYSLVVHHFTHSKLN